MTSEYFYIILVICITHIIKCFDKERDYAENNSFSKLKDYLILDDSMNA